jgi:hypothetical protein
VPERGRGLTSGILSQHLPRESGEFLENPRQDISSPIQDFKPETPEKEAGELHPTAMSVLK